jgi:hypothetical protein
LDSFKKVKECIFAIQLEEHHQIADLASFKVLIDLLKDVPPQRENFPRNEGLTNWAERRR